MTRFWIAVSVGLLALFVVGCDGQTSSEAEGTNIGECSDEIDNDGDTFVDCADTDCANASNCGDDDTGDDDDDVTDDDDDTGDDDDDFSDIDGVEDHDPGPCSELCVNEFMASNATGAQDATGAFPDWLELYNPTGADIALDGYFVSDDLAWTDKHVMAGGLVVPAGGHLILWVDGDIDQGDDHLPFRLNRGGEQIGIYDPAGTALDEMSYGPQETDISASRTTDGAEEWVEDDTSTPAGPNG